MTKTISQSLSTILALFITLVIIFGCLIFNLPLALAGGLSGEARYSEQMVQSAEQKVQTALQSTSATANSATAGATVGLLEKETLLDGIGWAIAKQMVSNMTASLVEWINSGFEGSPAFVTDLDAFLLDALDTVAGEYIKSLGEVGELICSPFTLDVQVALETNYEQSRSGMPSGATAPACKLTDIKDNIEGFLTGAGDTGWEDWLSVTSNPQNTPYGAYLEAEKKLGIRLRNEAGNEVEVASWGDGFLSKKVCESIEGSSGTGGTGQTTAATAAGTDTGATGNCTITTPGQVISEALTFQLSTGPQALIEADEINEIVGALINQLTLQAMQGINGLLGLSESDQGDYVTANGATGTKSYLDSTRDEAATLLNITGLKQELDDSLEIEASYLRLASSTISKASISVREINRGVTALNQIFNGPNQTYELLNITGSSTPTSAQAALASARRGNPSASERDKLDIAQTELDNLTNSFDSIAATSEKIGTSTQLYTLSFDRLVKEAARTQNTLVSLQTEITKTLTRTEANVLALRDMVRRFEKAPENATPKMTAGDIRQEVAQDFIKLINSGKLASESMVVIKRVEWNEALR